MSALRFDNVTVRLGAQGAQNALAGVSFETAGGLTALVGPNGSGKTTLLRAAAGLTPLHAGAVTLDGAAVTEMPARTRGQSIAYLPQERRAAWSMPGRALVALGRHPYAGPLRRETGADRAAIERALDAADAQRFADRNVDTLSGGERARILLARAFAVEAPVLLADEPTAALDPAHQLSVLGALKGAAENGALVLTALHDLSLARRFADCIIVMDKGSIAADGAPDAALSDGILERVFAVRQNNGVLELAKP